MTQPSRNQPRTPLGLLDSDHDRPPAAPENLPTDRQPQPVRRYAFGQVVVLEVTGRLSDVVEALDPAIEQALSDGPRGVVCDLSGIVGDSEPDAVERLATAGRHVRDWPGIPVAVACPDRQVRVALKAHPLGSQLVVAKSLLSTVAGVLATPTPAVKWLRLAPTPTAPRASRDFVTRALMNWRLGELIPSVCLVASELVTNSTVHAGTDIDVSVAWNQRALRLTVKDRSPDLPRQQHYDFDRHGRGLTIVAGLSRAFGVLPTSDGGKAVWAVFDVPHTSHSTRLHRVKPVRRRPKPAATTPEPATQATERPPSPPFEVARADRSTDSPAHPFNDTSNFLG